MPEIPLADPGASELDAEFQRAMEGPSLPREPSSPPEIDPEAPHGRDKDGVPLAPFGLKKDGTPAKIPGGRRVKDAQPRIGPPATATAARDGKVVQPEEPKDYTKDLGETGDSIWLALSAIGSLPVLPKSIADRVGAEAAIFKANQDNLVKALDTAAAKNARARALAEKLSAGEVSWVITAGSLCFPFLVQTAMVMRGGEDVPLADMAARNKSDLQDYVTALGLSAEEMGEPPVPVAA